MYTEKQLEYVRSGRHFARTDTLWLAKNILKMDKVVEHVHRPMANCLQQFTRQGQDVLYTRGEFLYTPEHYDPSNVYKIHNSLDRRRLLLAPRGWYKTSLNVITHTIQWILNFPDVTILLVHASQETLEQMFQVIKDAFHKNTVMRYFFPQFCPPARSKEFGTQHYFEIPCRKIKTAAPTVSIAGIESIRTGMHYHVIKFTDIVDEKNSATKEQCQKIIYSYGMCRNLLISPQYWIDIEGTRYHFSDLYGRIVDQWAEEEKKGKEHTFKIFAMGCYKKDVKDEDFSPDELDAPYLLDEKGRPISRFPEEFPYEKLEEMRNDPVTGEQLFASQQLNNPTETQNDEAPFPYKYLRWIDRKDLPQMMFYQTSLDLADTTNKRSNYTVITTCGIDRQNKRYVVDVRLGKMLPDKIVTELFQVVRVWRPISVKLEESSAQRMLMPTISRMSDLSGVRPNFAFIQRDNQTSKVERILALQPWYKSGLLLFCSDLPEFVKEHLKHELTRFPKYAYDDLLDTLADQFQDEVKFGPLKNEESMEKLLEKAQRIMMQRADEFNRVFNLEKKDPGAWKGLGGL